MKFSEILLTFSSQWLGCYDRRFSVQERDFMFLTRWSSTGISAMRSEGGREGRRTEGLEWPERWRKARFGG